VLEDVVVEVRDADLHRLGILLPEHRRLRGAPVVNAPGEWSLTIPADHRLAGALAAPGAGIIVTGPDDVWWSGPVTKPALDAGASDPNGTLTVTGLTDDVVLADATAWPEPSNGDVATQATAYDTQSGPAETLMRHYVAANIGPAAPPARRGRLASLLTLEAVDEGRGGASAKSARFDNLAELLREIALPAGLVFRVVQRGEVLVFEVREPTDRTALIRLDVRNGGIASQAVATSPPGVTRVIVAGQGEGEARTLLAVTDATAAEAETAWGRVLEQFKDQRQTDDPAELLQAGTEALAEAGFTATDVAVVPGEATRRVYGVDWHLGDRVTVVVQGQETSTTVTGALVLDDNAGLRVGMSLGDVSGFTPTAALTARVDDTARRVSALERTVDPAAEPPPPPPISPPTGSIIMHGAAAAPSGWLRCDGSAVSRTTYAELFAVIGTAYGVGDGGTTFNLPDLVSRFPRGATAPGSTGGAATHVHGLTTAVADLRLFGGGTSVFGRNRTSPSTRTMDRTFTSAAPMTNDTFASAAGVALTGETDSASSLPPYASVVYIIRT